jgi:hypothetical protein
VSSLSTGAIVGIAIATVLLGGAAAMGALLLMKALLHKNSALLNAQLRANHMDTLVTPYKPM